MSTNKIEGYADGITVRRESMEIASITLFTDKRFEDLSPATLVIHSGEREPVYTQSEVKAIMQKMNDGFEAEMRTSVQFPGHLEVDESVVHDKLDEACEAFGITL